MKRIAMTQRVEVVPEYGERHDWAMGAGEALFERWKQARTLSVDCMNQKVVVVA